MKMEAYTGFAEVYDIFMDNIPYEEWASYVIELLEKNGITPESENKRLIDLGCGTGTFTALLAEAGFEMTGIDNSEDMLVIANNKKYEQEEISSMVYSLQDMRSFRVPFKAAAVISVCDSVNYIIEEEDLEKTFKCVKKALMEDGIFIFDLKTIHFFRDVLGEGTIAENRDDAAFIWDNYYYEDEAVNEYQLAVFVQEEEGLYRKYEEMHVQKGHTIEQVKSALALAGFVDVNVYEAFSRTGPTDESERIYFTAKAGA